MQTMRKTGTKIFSWVLLILLLVGLLTGCGANDQENSADRRKCLHCFSFQSSLFLEGENKHSIFPVLLPVLMLYYRKNMCKLDSQEYEGYGSF